MSSPEPLLEFADVMRRLRAECPWKAAQTHASLVRYLLEETHETIEAIEGLDRPDGSGATATTDDDLREELGDLLLQVYFHAAFAEQEGRFSLDDVARGITEKMIRRNPHVFGDRSGERPADADAVNDEWQRLKAAEKQRSGLTDGLPASLPALLWADKVLDRLTRAGSRNPDPPSIVDPDEIGERLLATVAEAHAAGVDPEQALRAAVRRRLPD